MEIIGKYWYRGLALAVLFVLVGWYGPFALSAIGFPHLNLLSDGNLLVFGLLVYGVGVLSILGLASETIRSRVIPKQNGLFSFIIPLIVVVGYLTWGSLALSLLLDPPPGS